MKKILFVAESLNFGGIQKSMLSFLAYVVPQADIDLLVWRKSGELPIPQGVNFLSIPTVKSVRYSLQNDGLLSRALLLSVLGSFFRKRWTPMTKLTRKYDIAIAFSNGGYGKYYVIDKVCAKRKYTFFHNGIYDVTPQIAEFDREYYPQFDMVFCVSSHVSDFIRKLFPIGVQIAVIPNLIGVEEIRNAGESECPEMAKAVGIRILSVGRLSDEKNPMALLETARELKRRGVQFHWYIVGSGDLKESLQTKINSDGLSRYCTLCGGQLNPYRFMKRCDVFVQLSRYESDGLTNKEAAIFGKPLVLSRIPVFEDFLREYENMTLCEAEDTSSVADAIQTMVGHQETGKVTFCGNTQGQAAIRKLILETEEKN